MISPFDRSMLQDFSPGKTLGETLGDTSPSWVGSSLYLKNCGTEGSTRRLLTSQRTWEVTLVSREFPLEELAFLLQKLNMFPRSRPWREKLSHRYLPTTTPL